MPETSRRELLRAVLSGNVEKLATLQQAGTPLDGKTEKEQWSLIHSALLLVGQRVPQESLRLLIASGADATGADCYGNTPLHYAVRSGDLASARTLVDGGADVNRANHSGVTPLQQSLLQAAVDAELVEYLLSAGGNPQHVIGPDRTIRDFVATIAHGANASLSALFERYAGKA